MGSLPAGQQRALDRLWQAERRHRAASQPADGWETVRALRPLPLRAGVVPRLGYPTKEEAACCLALVDDLGRPPIGFCGPDCERRPR